MNFLRNTLSGSGNGSGNGGGIGSPNNNISINGPMGVNSNAIGSPSYVPTSPTTTTTTTTTSTSTSANGVQKKNKKDFELDEFDPYARHSTSPPSTSSTTNNNTTSSNIFNSPFSMASEYQELEEDDYMSPQQQSQQSQSQQQDSIEDDLQSLDLGGDKHQAGEQLRPMQKFKPMVVSDPQQQQQQHSQSVDDMFQSIDLFSASRNTQPTNAFEQLFMYGNRDYLLAKQKQEQQEQELQQKMSPQQSEQQQQQQLQPISVPKIEKQDLIAPKPFDMKAIERIINGLKETTMLHHETQSEKTINEEAIRSLYRRLWSVVEEPITVNDHCPCGNLCTHKYKNQVNRLNIDAAKQLETLLKQNHHYNTTQFIGSLFQQTLNELRLAVAVYSNIATGDTHPASVISQMLVHLTAAFKDTKPPQSVITLLMHLHQTLVTKLENSPARRPVHKVVEIDFFEEGEPETPGERASEDDIKGVEILSTLNREMTFNFNEEFLSWGYMLVHPSAEDLFQNDWMLKLFHVEQLAAGRQQEIAYLKEETYVNLLLQIDFSNFRNLINYSNLNIQDKLLLPLQKGLEMSIQLKMTKLSIAIGKIVCLIGFYFPSEVENCITILYKTIWPSQLISCTMMPFFNWSALNGPCLTNLFTDLYQLTMTPLEYSKLQDSAKYQSRYQFVYTLFSYQPVVTTIYVADPAVSTANSNGIKFPQLLALRRIAQHASTDKSGLLLDGGTIYHLSRLIMDELFYFAFIFKVPANMVVDATLFQNFKSEIYTHIFTLMQTMPHLVNRFMYNIAQQLLYIDAESFTAFIEPRANSPLYFWDMSGDGISWLGFVLCQRLLPIIDEAEFIEQHQSIIQQFIIDPPPYEIAPNHMQHATNIVFKVLLNVNWDKVTPLARLKTILVLIGARKYVGNMWISFFLNHSRLLLCRELNKTFIRAILNVNPRTIFHFNDNMMFVYIQVMLTLNQCMCEPVHSIGSSAQLAEQFVRIQSLPVNYEMLSSLMCFLVFILKDEPGRFDRELLTLYSNITQNRNQYTANLNVILLFLKPWFTTSMDWHPQLLAHWVHILKQNMTDEENVTILNYLACGSFLKNYGTEFEDLFATQTSYNLKGIQKLSIKRPWIAYFLAVNQIKTKKGTQSKLKESMQFFKELAMDLKGDPVSLIFWEQFWILYYDLVMGYQTDPLSQEAKNEIYQCVSIYNVKQQMPPVVKRIYETFTTWNKESILPINGRMLSLENHELWRVYSSTAMWIFKKTEDKLYYENNQRNWLNSLTSDINPEVLVKQLAIAPRQLELYTTEQKKYQSYEDYFNEAAHAILKSTVVESIKMFNDLKIYLGHSKRLSQDIMEDDRLFLELSQTMHATKQTKSSVVLKCKASRCLGITVPLELKKSAPNNQVTDLIKENRRRFNEHFYALFERVYQMAILALTLEDSRLHDLYFRKEDLFATIVQISAEHGAETVTETIIYALTEIAYRIGCDILEKDPSNQAFLLNIFLPQFHEPLSADPSEERGQRRALITDYSLFLRLFSPTTVVDLGKYLEYLEQCVSNTNIIVQQRRSLFESFKIEQRIQPIVQMPGGKERLFALLPAIVSTNALEPAAVVINSLLFVDSTYLINTTMTLVKGYASNELAERIYGKGKQFYEFLKSIKPEQQQLIVQTLVEKVSDIKSPTGLAIVSHLVFYEFLTKPFVQSLLAKIRLIYIQAVRPNERGILLTDSEFEQSIRFFTELIALIPRSINMVWEVFFYGYIPLLDKYRKQGVKKDYSANIVAMMGELVAEGHLEFATFHIQPNDILEQMCNVITQTEYGEIVVALFSILDWEILRTMPKIPDHIALHYLKLCIYITILNGTSILAPELGLSLANEGSLDWFKCGDLSDASIVFDGLALVNMIKCPSLNRNPTTQIIDALSLVKDITLYLDNYNLAVALSLEIRSLLYLTAINQNGRYWYMPHQQQFQLVQTMLLPLIRSLAENKDAKDTEQSGTQQRMKNILKTMLSCLDYDPSSKAISCKALGFATDPLPQENLNKDLYNKVQTLILNFCSTLTSNLCIQLMPITHIALQGSSFCLVLEAILHSFLQDENTQVSTLINKYLVFTDAESIITKSIQNNCPLTLYIVVLQQIKSKTLDSNQLLELISNINFQHNREYELWIVWILIIKMVRNNDINLKNKPTVQKLAVVKSWIQSFNGTTNPIVSLFSKNKSIIPQTHLASRACLVFLQKVIVQQQGKSKEDEQLLSSTLEGLVDLRKKTDNYKSFDSFFVQIDNFMSPICEVDDFCLILIQTLVPFASYLSNLMKYEP
ncbi:hypothetical protein SAMD00019534_070270 [Acytostelium subglobosum LB1]|uniref:hypothetical protein n=1 Tax=Acytostelium subglobosum LB1 TaxID=1410327 RepID=UPI0006452080|nr:hypothetical protein SAMD00019534_070270 [Acytostelium subglobosum LB1]GAM23852.1 hypothetical protein SAMD00019534_070270 [Acytostelium subglobosum LB1]|eukprot:XP_012752888.1 hypothetical protein SAMD00019534_070270 [Acytostelium subglobosum LB1]